MANGTYEINVNVTGAPSGSDQFAKQEGQPTTTDITEEPSRGRRPEQQPIIQDRTRRRIQTAAGYGLVGGFMALEQYEQNAKFRGDSNTAVQINEGKKWYARGATLLAAASTGNPLLMGIAIGTMAFQLAQENRELINARSIDTYKSTYYQQRLVNDISKRSR